MSSMKELVDKSRKDVKAKTSDNTVGGIVDLTTQNKIIDIAEEVVVETQKLPATDPVVTKTEKVPELEPDNATLNQGNYCYQ